MPSSQSILRRIRLTDIVEADRKLHLRVVDKREGLTPSHQPMAYLQAMRLLNSRAPTHGLSLNSLPTHGLNIYRVKIGCSNRIRRNQEIRLVRQQEGVLLEQEDARRRPDNQV